MSRVPASGVVGFNVHVRDVLTIAVKSAVPAALDTIIIHGKQFVGADRVGVKVNLNIRVR